MIKVMEKAESIEELDFEPGCQMFRCKDSPNQAVKVMTVAPIFCACRAKYLICQPCIEYFWAEIAKRKMRCDAHPDEIYLWDQITTFIPL